MHTQRKQLNLVNKRTKEIIKNFVLIVTLNTREANTYFINTHIIIVITTDLFIINAKSNLLS